MEQKIKDLLKKYYEGNTSLDEENSLKESFSKLDVTTENYVDKELLCFFKIKDSDLESNQNFEEKLIKLIDNQERRPKVVPYLYQFLTMAASIAIIITCFLVIYQQAHKFKLKDTYKDPQLAYLEAKRSLYYISERLNKGTRPLNEISKMEKGVSHLSSISYLNAEMKKLEIVSKYYDHTTLEKNKK